MYCCIKEWPNKMATLMTVDGIVLCTFASTDEARKVWREWHQQQMQCQITTKNPPYTLPPEPNIEIFSSTSSFSAWLKNIVASCQSRKRRSAVSL
jgi:hypothetical protein